MEPEVAIQPPVSLSGFCKTVIANRSGKWPPNEDAIAHEFVSFFGIDGLLGMGDLERLCQTLGVAVSIRELPKPLRGHNCLYDGKSEIVVGTVAGPTAGLGPREHTLLHELRELIEYEFRKLGRPVATTPSDLESRAEDFASLARAVAPLKALEWVFDAIGGIESRLLQFAAIALVCILAMGHYLYCLTLPQWEDQLAK